MNPGVDSRVKRVHEPHNTDDEGTPNGQHRQAADPHTEMQAPTCRTESAFLAYRRAMWVATPLRSTTRDSSVENVTLSRAFRTGNRAVVREFMHERCLPPAPTPASKPSSRR